MNGDTTTSDVRRMAAPPGGIMTREAGAVTGDVEVWLDASRPDVVRVRYAGALDEYTVVGSAAGRDLDAVVTALATDPGTDVVGNPLAVDLGTAPTTAGGGPGDGAVAPAGDGAGTPAGDGAGAPDTGSGAAGHDIP